MQRSFGATCLFSASEGAGVADHDCLGDARSPDRVACHEAGHILVFRYFDFPVAGATVTPGPGYDGLTWHSDSAAARSNTEYEPSDFATKIAERILRGVHGPGEEPDASIIGDVLTQLAGLVGSCAAEAVVFEDKPPLLIVSDVRAAHALARIICRNEQSRAALIEHAYQEAFGLLQEHKPILLALATALDEQKTLNADQIDICIGKALAVEAIKVEHARREQWRRIEEGAAMFKREQTDASP
jgi:hypothetical protein